MEYYENGPWNIGWYDNNHKWHNTSTYDLDIHLNYDQLGFIDKLKHLWKTGIWLVD
jgi:hypothetical protein